MKYLPAKSSPAGVNVYIKKENQTMQDILIQVPAVILRKRCYIFQKWLPFFTIFLFRAQAGGNNRPVHRYGIWAYAL